MAVVAQLAGIRESGEPTSLDALRNLCAAEYILGKHIGGIKIEFHPAVPLLTVTRIICSTAKKRLVACWKTVCPGILLVVMQRDADLRKTRQTDIAGMLFKSLVFPEKCSRHGCGNNQYIE